MLADLQQEYFEALKAGRPRYAEWIEILHYIHIARAMTLDRVISTVVSYVTGLIHLGK